MKMSTMMINLKNNNRKGEIYTLKTQKTQKS